MINDQPSFKKFIVLDVHWNYTTKQYSVTLQTLSRVKWKSCEIRIFFLTSCKNRLWQHNRLLQIFYKTSLDIIDENQIAKVLHKRERTNERRAVE